MRMNLILSALLAVACITAHADVTEIIREKSGLVFNGEGASKGSPCDVKIEVMIADSPGSQTGLIKGEEYLVFYFTAGFDTDTMDPIISQILIPTSVLPYSSSGLYFLPEEGLEVSYGTLKITYKDGILTQIVKGDINSAIAPGPFSSKTSIEVDYLLNSIRKAGAYRYGLSILGGSYIPEAECVLKY